MEIFQNLKNLDIRSSCRTCLESTKEVQYNIFATQDLQKKFTVCTSLSAEPDDGHPTSLCEPCHSKIVDFYNFQQKCISARIRFQEYIQSKVKQCKQEFWDAPTDLNLITEPKEEQEENTSSDSLAEDFSNAQSHEEIPSADDKEESDDDQPIIKYNVGIKNTKNRTQTDSSPSKIKLECKICNETFMELKSLEEHMRSHKDLKPFQCQQCDKSFARPGRLKVHIRVKHEGKLFSCTEPGCEKKLCSKQTLGKHIADEHGEANGVKAKQPYICEECGKVLKGLSTLKNHMFLHSGQPRPHACPQCHKRYMTRCKLKDHMNRHAGIKNFVCPHCGAKKSSKSELKNHVNYHTREKTYPCHICNMVFNNIVNYSRHRRVVHEGIKNFKCSYCEKSFGKSETRKHHEMTHTGEKPHECNICHKKFIQIVSLKKHQKVHLKALGNNV